MKSGTAPATKADIVALKGDVVALKGDVVALKGDVVALKTDLLALEKRLKLYFDFSVEKLTGDYRGIFNDRTVDLTNARHDHERRLERLESRAGFAV